MPELPEVETARALIADRALGRRIVEVDDRDEYVCRPHQVGDLWAALRGRTLTAAHRRGKTMWCETSPLESGTEPGPDLGIHLGMAGRIIVTGADGDAVEGGGPRRRNASPHKPEWNRFTLTFSDGGELRLFDKRRLGRVRLDPDIDALGPDGLQITPAVFRTRVGTGKAPVKARLLDQSVVAGIGNLLADQLLWQAGIGPARRVDTLDRAELDALQRALKSALKSAITRGGVHTGRFIGHRHAGGTCPRCGTTLLHGAVGGRSTWWCPQDQQS